MKNISKSSLAILLSRLKTFETPSLKAEQYTTDSEIAATALWDAYMKGCIKGKTIADLGCGTGTLGIGCLILGAGKVYFIDNDSAALESAKENLSFAEKLVKTRLSAKAELLHKDIADFHTPVDLVVQNPPFGTRNKGADLAFLMKAMGLSPLIYSFHKASTLDYLQKYVARQGFSVVQAMKFTYPLSQTMRFHRKRIERIEVVCLHIVKRR
ncbi:MAG: METTL5 family protein [Nanoarchaeota archaeon]